jgi:hypothetical protein
MVKNFQNMNVRYGVQENFSMKVLAQNITTTFTPCSLIGIYVQVHGYKNIMKVKANP